MKRVNLLAAGMLVLGQVLSGGASAASVTVLGSTVDFTFDDSLTGLEHVITLPPLPPAAVTFLKCIRRFPAATR